MERVKATKCNEVAGLSEGGTGSQEMMFLTTWVGLTPVSLWSRPWKRKASFMQLLYARHKVIDWGFLIA